MKLLSSQPPPNIVSTHSRASAPPVFLGIVTCVLLPPALAGDFLPKGSVTIDGVSLTVGEVFEADGETRFNVYLIPHTLEITGFGTKQVGETVNLEADVLGRWVRHHLERIGSA